jgi:hypothetical protein
MPCESEITNEKPRCPFTTHGVYVSFLLRFIHMLAHIPLGFGDFSWAIKFHDRTGDIWDEYEGPNASGFPGRPSAWAVLRAITGR